MCWGGGGGGRGGGRKRERVAIRELGGPPKFGYREIDLKLTKCLPVQKFCRDLAEILARYRLGALTTKVRETIGERSHGFAYYLLIYFTSNYFSFHCKKEGNPPGPSLYAVPY